MFLKKRNKFFSSFRLISYLTFCSYFENIMTSSKDVTSAWTCSIDMGMQYSIAWTCSKVMQHGHIAWAGSIDILQGSAAWRSSMDMQQRRAAWIYNMEMQQGHIAWKCGIDMQH